MLFEMKSRWNSAVLFSVETESLKLAVELAVEQGADLRDADLRDANLGDANLRGADLGDANLRGADLGGAYLGGADLGGANLGDSNLGDANLGDANLRGADLGGADLGGANLGGADLGGADLRGADLGDSDLGGADLGGAYLGGADLRGADLGDSRLRGADLRPIRDDFFAVLSSAPAEVKGLIAAIKEGRIDGSTYEGKCACLVGTIANMRGLPYTELGLLKPKSSRPAERFFLSIKQGDTPETNQAS